MDYMYVHFLNVKFLCLAFACKMFMKQFEC